MTKTEKLQIYNLLKTASDSFYGFFSPNFPDEAPDFEDDIIPEKTSDLNDSQIENQTASQIKDEADAATEISDSAEKSPSSQFSSSLSSNEKNEKSTIENINSKVLACKRCALCAGRRQAVPGMGAENPLVLVIGEGPGEEEDKQGLPFVGPAGQLLDKMLAAIHLYRNKNCYIANIVKCRPPMNRVPFPEEADACRPFLDAQIAALKPKAILCAGSTAVKNLLHTNSGVMKLHGKVLDYNGIPLVTTWHPSALLRAPENKRPAWEDLKIFRNELLKINPGYESD